MYDHNMMESHDLEQIHVLLKQSYKETLEPKLPYHIDELEMELYRSFQTLEDGDSPISKLCATPIVEGCIPGNTLNIILAVVGDCKDLTNHKTEFKLNLNIGGETYGQPITLCPFNKPSPLLTDTGGSSWPVVSLDYHMVQLKNFDQPDKLTQAANLWALGVRVKKEYLSLISSSVIPRICMFHRGLCKPIDASFDSTDLPIWKPLS